MPRPRPDKISLLLADVDGTLVTKEKLLTPRAQQAVADLKARGIAFAMTSGRPPKGMLMLIEPLQVSTPIAGFNGGLFVNPDLSIIARHALQPATARKAADAIEKRGLDVWVYADDEWLVRDPGAPHVAREQKTVAFPPRVVKAFTDDMFGNVIKIVGVSDDHDAVAGCEKEVRSLLGGDVSAAQSQPYYLDVTEPNANKGAVVAYLAQHLCIPAGEIATIGDMANDVLMFKPSGFAIAMGNASAEVQAQADAVTDTCENDGFAKAVEKFIL